MSAPMPPPGGYDPNGSQTPQDAKARAKAEKAYRKAQRPSSHCRDEKSGQLGTTSSVPLTSFALYLTPPTVKVASGRVRGGAGASCPFRFAGADLLAARQDGPAQSSGCPVYDDLGFIHTGRCRCRRDAEVEGRAPRRPGAAEPLIVDGGGERRSVAACQGDPSVDDLSVEPSFHRPAVAEVGRGAVAIEDDREGGIAASDRAREHFASNGHDRR